MCVCVCVCVRVCGTCESMLNTVSASDVCFYSEYHIEISNDIFFMNIKISHTSLKANFSTPADNKAVSYCIVSCCVVLISIVLDWIGL